MDFNITALNVFRDFNVTNQDAIANFNTSTGKVQQNGTYRGGFIGLFRAGKTEDRNNVARSELLKALGNAFGLDGVGTNNAGKVTFSKGFVAKLSKLLGNDLRLKDFSIAPDGTVSSGKPLTQRRITAIIRRAMVVANGGFNADIYRAKLDMVKAELAKMPENKDAKRYFEHIGKCLEFVDKTLDTLLDENIYWDDNEAQRNPDYKVPRFVFRKPGDFEGTPVKDRSMFVNYICQDQDSYIGVFHFEKYKNLPKELKTQEDVNANVGYVRSTIQLYVQTAIDLFFDAKEAGKLQEFLEKTSEPGACMDDRASRPGEWRRELGLLKVEEDFSVNVANHGPDTKLDECIYEEMRVANNNIKGAKSWNDLAGAVKKELVGSVRPIMTVENGKIVPLMEDGVQVVREVKASDIDLLGPVCANILGIFDA